MYMILSYPVGVALEAVVLSQETGRMRVAVAGISDTVELNQCGTQWLADNQPVEIDFLMSTATDERNSSLPMTMAAAAIVVWQ